MEDDDTSLTESSSVKACSQESPVVAAVLKVMAGAFAVRQDRPELVARLLAAKGDVNAQVPISALARRDGVASNNVPPEAAKQQCPLLHLAALAGLPDTFRDLWQNGAETNWRDNVGWTLLHACASGGNVNVTQLCLESIVTEVDICDSDNDTPLHVAAFAGRDAVAKLLLDRKADATRIDADQCSPLHCACRSGVWPLVERLLEARADPSAVDGHGGTPMAYAVLSHADGLEDVGIALLRAAGARVCEPSMVVAQRQLTSKPACDRCIAVDKELRRLKEVDVQDDAEQAAANAAKMLLDEETFERSKETKASKSKRNKKQSHTPARQGTTSFDSIATASTSSNVEMDTRSDEAAVSPLSRPSVGDHLCMEMETQLDEMVVSEKSLPASTGDLIKEVDEKREKEFGVEQSRPSSNTDDCDMQVHVVADTDAVEKVCDRGNNSEVVVDLSVVDATKTLLESIFHRVLDKGSAGVCLSSAIAENDCVQIVRNHRSIAKKGSLASRRANGELFDSKPLQAERKRLKRQRQMARKQVSRLSCADNEKCDCEERKNQDLAIPQSLRAEAPEFLPPALTVNQFQAGRLLPDFVMNIPWGYEMGSFYGPEDANDIATGDVSLNSVCFDAIMGDATAFDAAYCYGYDYLQPAALPCVSYPMEFASEGFGDSDYDEDSYDQVPTKVSQIADDDMCLAQIFVHIVVQRVLAKLKWPLDEVDVSSRWIENPTCLAGEQFFSTKPVVVHSRPSMVGDEFSTSPTVTKDSDDAPSCESPLDYFPLGARHIDADTGMEESEEQPPDYFLRRCGGYELSVIDGSDQLVALPR